MMDPGLKAAYRLWAEVNNVTLDDAILMAANGAELANMVRMYFLQFEKEAVSWKNVVEALSE